MHQFHTDITYRSDIDSDSWTGYRDSVADLLSSVLLILNVFFHMLLVYSACVNCHLVCDLIVIYCLHFVLI